MKAVILAGGEGKRLRPISGHIPKPMIRLLGRPVIDHILTLLQRSGVTEVCAALGYMPEVLQAHLEALDTPGLFITCHTESRPLGTAGSVKACADFTGAEDFLVISGDAACDFDLGSLIARHARRRPAATIVLCEQEEPLEYGLVLTDREGRVTSFIEKPGWDRVVTNLVNTGIYILTPEAMALVPEDTPFDFARDLFPMLLERGMEIWGAVMPGYWCDIGTPKSYYKCNLDAISGRLHLPEPWGEDKPVQSPHTPAPSRQPLPYSRAVPCASRARAMRRISESLMEAGADFLDGITLHSEGADIHIAPAADRSEIIIETSRADGPGARYLDNAYARWIQSPEQR